MIMNLYIADNEPEMIHQKALLEQFIKMVIFMKV